MTTRRSFLTTTSMAAAAFGTSWRRGPSELAGLGLLDPPPRRGIRVDDPDLKALAQRALDAATAAGASYADVRFTFIRTRKFTGDETHILPPRESETIAVGVRALAQGAWGFMADTELTPEIMDWLGKSAATLGKAIAWPNRPSVDLGARPPAAVGHWEMPVKRDPFTVPDAEIMGLSQKLVDKIRGEGCQIVQFTFNFSRQERTFASTDGAYTTQVVYDTLGNIAPDASELRLKYRTGSKNGLAFFIPLISPCGMGYEVIEDANMLEQIPAWVARAREAEEAKPIEAPGRFDVVFDAHAVAGLVSTLGSALQMDRALGYEANASGTSYLAPIEKVLGAAQFPTDVTVTANRTMAGGAATVHWDDEGIAAQEFPLVKNGAVVDYVTNRQFAPELSGWYKTHQQPLQSRGCAGAQNALSLPLIQTPNLQLQPGAKNTSFMDLVAGIDDGFAVMGGDLELDQQQLNALGGQRALIYTVKKGKLKDVMDRAGFVIRMPDLWKDLVALGGEQSAATRGFTVQKGQLEQSSVHSVQAVAARFKNVVVRTIDA